MLHEVLDGTTPCKNVQFIWTASTKADSVW